jgi:hypothetical protein
MSMVEEIANPICFCGKTVHIPNIPLVMLFSGYAFCPQCPTLEKTNNKILTVIHEYNGNKTITQ